MLNIVNQILTSSFILSLSRCSSQFLAVSHCPILMEASIAKWASLLLLAVDFVDSFYMNLLIDYQSQMSLLSYSYKRLYFYMLSFFMLPLALLERSLRRLSSYRNSTVGYSFWESLIIFSLLALSFYFILLNKPIADSFSPISAYLSINS